MTALPVIANATARALFLERHQLAQPPLGHGNSPQTGRDLRQIIAKLGFVQVDSINTLARAHDHILRTRQTPYKPRALHRALEQDRTAFEHWTHDAAVLPIEMFPYWRLKFERDATWLARKWSDAQRRDMAREMDAMRNRIARDGAICAADAADGKRQNGGGWWEWQPQKVALEYLWRTGDLSICHRRGFQKIYDLSERVIPPEQLNARIETPQILDWACAGALDRLGFATSGEIAAFWDLTTKDEAKRWCARALAAGQIIEVEIKGADGTPRRSFARPGILDYVARPPGQRLRILSPFDPTLRDRKRALRLFGFDYRIEVFVPEAQRTYGYYVFPVLEGTKIIGRIDMKAHRAEGTLVIKGFWPERGVKLTAQRAARLARACAQMGRFGGATQVTVETNTNTDILREASQFTGPEFLTGP